MNCIDYRSLTVMAPLEILEHPDQDKLNNHLLECIPCRDHFSALEGCFQALTLDLDETPFEARGLWDKILDQAENADLTKLEDLEASEAEPASNSLTTISLSCTFCRDSLIRREAKYCASCLAPHHQECFRDHGQCSAFGCEETYIVAAQPVVEAGPTPRGGWPRRRSRIVMAALMLTVSMPVAAVTWLSVSNQRSKIQTPPTTVAQRTSLQFDSSKVGSRKVDSREIDPNENEGGILSFFEEFPDGQGGLTTVIPIEEAKKRIQQAGDGSLEPRFENVDMDHPRNRRVVYKLLMDELKAAREAHLAAINEYNHILKGLMPRLRPRNQPAPFSSRPFKHHPVSKSPQGSKLDDMRARTRVWLRQAKDLKSAAVALKKIQNPELNLGRPGTLKEAAETLEQQTGAMILVAPSVKGRSVSSQLAWRGSWRPLLERLVKASKTLLEETDSGTIFIGQREPEVTLAWEGQRRFAFEKMARLKGVNLVICNEIKEDISATFTKKPWTAVFESLKASDQVTSRNFHDVIVVEGLARKHFFNDSRSLPHASEHLKRVTLTGNKSLKQFCHELASQQPVTFHVYTRPVLTRKERIECVNVPFLEALRVLCARFELNFNWRNLSYEMALYQGELIKNPARAALCDIALWSRPKTFMSACGVLADDCFSVLSRLSGKDMNTQLDQSTLSMELRHVRFEDMISLAAHVLGTTPKYRDGIFNIGLKSASYVMDYAPHTKLDFDGTQARSKPIKLTMVAGDDSQRLAVVDGTIFKEGDLVFKDPKITVKSIGPNEVVFQCGDKIQRVLVKEGD